MLPILTAPQIREADAYSIGHEPVSSVDLMERAAAAFTRAFIQHYPDQQISITIYCGTGNNGGDGLAIARLLRYYHYLQVKVVITRFSERSTPDFDVNFERMISLGINYTELLPGEPVPAENSDLLIDAMLGSGLNKPLTGHYARVVNYLNGLNKAVVAVDIPTGFFAEGEIDNDAVVLKTDLVITFQQPKLNFLLPESGPYIKDWEVVNIGLDEGFIVSLNSPYQFMEAGDIKKRIVPRRRFSNKGTYGHALIIAGQPETMGAALLSASACLYGGAGLTTACIPESGLTALNALHPEIMAIMRQKDSVPEVDWEKFSTIAIGPGLGKKADALSLLQSVFQHFNKPLVIDADALNLLSENEALWAQVPKGSIITPHMKEFDRLFGTHANWWLRLQTAIKKAKAHQIYIVLKNSYTMIATPDGKCYFNSTGNAAMAGSGMGDVLTGFLTALLAQKYNSEEACLIGTYIHGQAGDDLALPHQRAVVTAGSLAAHLPVVMANFLT